MSGGQSSKSILVGHPHGQVNGSKKIQLSYTKDTLRKRVDGCAFLYFTNLTQPIRR